MKIKFKQAFPKPNNTSIIIYYSKNGEEMKYPTGVSISNEKDRAGKYKDWDYKQNTLKPYVQDFDIKRKKIEILLSKANRILSLNFEQGVMPSTVELKELIDQEEIIKDRTINSLITELFNGFHQMKSEYFIAKGSIKSLTDYTATKHMLLDYEAERKKRFKIVDINNQWLIDLLNFVRTKRPKKIEEYKVKTKGELVDKTSSKRFNILAQFFEFLKDQKLVSQEYIDMIKKFRSKEIKVIRTDKVTLTVKEIHKLYEFKFANKTFEKIRDVFIFACLTGIRYKDILEFDKKFIFENVDEGGFIYRKKASKTLRTSGVNYEIPLCDIVGNFT